jgi:3-oxoacyl-[acyl-carrier-protein] synthase III
MPPLTNASMNRSQAVSSTHWACPKRLPFAIGQAGTAGVFNALSMIEALVSLGGKVLLVASDKWLYPFFRAWGDLVVYGDGAAAILLDGDSEPAPGWGSIRASAMHYGTAIDNPWGLTPAALAERLHPLAVSAAQTAIERAGLQASDIDWVLPAGFSDSFSPGRQPRTGHCTRPTFRIRCPRPSVERGSLAVAYAPARHPAPR